MKKTAIIALLAALTLAGCGKVNDYVKEKDAPAVETEKKEDKVSETTEKEAEELGFSFVDVSNLEFYFSSGAGGWYTMVTIDENGAFEGSYQDSDLGVTGADYPNGTIYFSDFKGKFSDIEKVNDYTYKFQIETIDYANETGTEETKDGTHYIYTDAYGLEDAGDLYMYLPGTPLKELSEEVLSWLHISEDATETELPFYALCNVEQEEAFSSYEALDENQDTEASGGQQEQTQETPRSEVRELAANSLSAAQQRSDVLEEKLAAGDLSQLEMNQISYENYMVWDEQLNYIWKLMKENLPEDQMNDILQEERAWIKEKEKKVKEAGAENEGGSLQPLLENTEAADLTKTRAYELLEYLN